MHAWGLPLRSACGVLATYRTPQYCLPVRLTPSAPLILAFSELIYFRDTQPTFPPIPTLQVRGCPPPSHARGQDGRSGGTVSFAERLCGLLGAGSRIFPPSGLRRRPKYKVSDVVADLYQLRNEMAHGLPFHEKFRKTRGFLADGDEPIAEEFATFRYDQVLEECAAFLLCGALREVLLRNRTFDIHTMSWCEQD